MPMTALNETDVSLQVPQGDAKLTREESIEFPSIEKALTQPWGNLPPRKRYHPLIHALRGVPPPFKKLLMVMMMMMMMMMMMLLLLLMMMMKAILIIIIISITKSLDVNVMYTGNTDELRRHWITDISCGIPSICSGQ